MGADPFKNQELSATSFVTSVAARAFGPLSESNCCCFFLFAENVFHFILKEKNNMESFHLETYIARLEASYTDAGQILSTANAFLDKFATAEHSAWLEKGTGGEEEEEEGDEAVEEGWTEVKKRKLSMKALMKAPDVTPTDVITDKNPFLTKHTKKDFYQFQVTDRWRKKAERIASRLDQKRDYFGRVRSSRNFEKKT